MFTHKREISKLNEKKILSSTLKASGVVIIIFFICRSQAGDGGTIAQVNAMELKVNTLEPIISVLHGEMNRCISAIEALENRLRQEAAALQECRQRVEQQETRMVEMTATLAQKNEQLCMVETRLLTSSQDKPDGTLLWRIPNFSQVSYLKPECDYLVWWLERSEPRIVNLNVIILLFKNFFGIISIIIILLLWCCCCCW